MVAPQSAGDAAQMSKLARKPLAGVFVISPAFLSCIEASSPAKGRLQTMRGPLPLHQHPCSFCGTPVPCRCLGRDRPALLCSAIELTQPTRDYALWCAACEERYVAPNWRDA